MILNYYKLGKQNKGSSLTFSALGGRGKEKKDKPAAKISASPSEGEAEFPPHLFEPEGLSEPERPPSASPSLWTPTEFVPTKLARRKF